MLELPWLLAQQSESLLSRLDPQTRVKVLAALVGLIILGVAMMALTWLGARAVRRYMGITSNSRRRKPELNPDDWAQKPLVPPLDDAPATESE
jgi:hypothetical protein